MGELGIINRLVLNSLNMKLLFTCSFNMFIVMSMDRNVMVNSNKNEVPSSYFLPFNWGFRHKIP